MVEHDMSVNIFHIFMPLIKINRHKKSSKCLTYLCFFDCPLSLEQVFTSINISIDKK